MSNPWGLTDRQAQVLVTLADGEPQKQAARDLGITQLTLQAHLVQIRKRMRIRTTLGCVVAWDRHVRAKG